MRDRLATLSAKGAATFDGPGLRFVETLLTKAEGLSGQAELHLKRRAEERLNTLEARFTEARASCEQTLEALTQVGADGDGRFKKAFEVGDFGFIRIHGARALERARSVDFDAERGRALALARRIRARGMVIPPDVRGRIEALEAGSPADLTVRGLADRLSETLFRDAAEQARSAVVVERAKDRRPAQAGHYNGEVLAARALEKLRELAPGYLRTYVGGLRELASLTALPEPPRPKRR